MKIKTEIEMDYYALMGVVADHYDEELSYAWEYINVHTDENKHYDKELTRIIRKAMDVKYYDFRFAFEKYIGEQGKINNHNMENLVAFGLTLEYFGMKDIEILY